MDRYSLEWFDEYCDELLDKMGSDLFPLAIKFNRFKTITLGFINDALKYMETTQKLSDDIKSLIVPGVKIPLQKDTINNIWEAAEPSDYYRLISAIPLTDNNGTDLKLCKEVKILKEGQRLSYSRDPFREATDEYPNVFRVSNLFQIDTGEKSTIVYNNALVSYVKKPVFGLLSDLEKRIVNLHDSAIEEIVLKTADSLRFSTGDATSVSNFNFNQTYGNGKGNNL